MATVRSYLSDIATVAEALADVVHAEAVRVPDLVPVPKTVAGQKDIPYHVFARAYQQLSRITFADLTPTSTFQALDIASAGRSPASQARMYSAWAGWCQHGVRYALLASNPMNSPLLVRPKVRKRLPEPLSERNVKDVLSAIAAVDVTARYPWPERDLSIAALLIGAGLRNSEVCALTCEQVVLFDTNDGYLRVVGKGAKVRKVPVPDVLGTVLAGYGTQRRETFGAPGPTEPFIVRHDATAFTDRALRRLVDKWYQRAGVASPKGHTVHAWRHSFATWAVDNHMDLPVLQQLLGHSSLATTQIYIEVSAQASTAAMATHPATALF